MEIQETKEVWIVEGNTDLTEGHGANFPLFACETEITAKRMGSGQFVQGSDCPIRKATAVRIGNNWLYPSLLTKATKDDLRRQEKLDEKRAVEQRLRALGVSDEDLALLKNQ